MRRHLGSRKLQSLIAALAVAGVSCAILLGGGGASGDSRTSAVTAHATRQHTASTADAAARNRVARNAANAAILIARRKRPQVVEPAAGDLAGAADPTATANRSLDTGASAQRDPAPAGAASAGLVRGPLKFSRAGDANTAAVQDGIALPPLTAPDSVSQIIQAGNQIAQTPYIWGGGHGRWLDHGYDCSGSVSYALAAAGYLNGPLTSGDLARWGKPGPGKWVTIYANGGHVWMNVAGLRFDTSGANSRNGGSRWQDAPRSKAGFAVRHPVGL